MFRTIPLSIIRSFSLYTQQLYMSYRFADSCEQDQDGTVRPDPARKLSANLYDIQLLFVQWKTHDGQRKCPKHVEFYSKNELEKLVHLVGFIIRKRLKSERLSGCRVRYMMLSSVLRVSKCTWLVYFGFVQFFPCFYFDFCQGRIPVNIGWPTSNGTSSTFWETMDWGIKG